MHSRAVLEQYWNWTLGMAVQTAVPRKALSHGKAFQPKACKPARRSRYMADTDRMH